MDNPLRLLLRFIPDSYIKSLAKNISSYAMNKLPRPIDTVTIDGTIIKIYKDGVFDNKLLSKEVEGYNTYYKLRKGDIVIDAGAYTGLYTTYAAKKVGKEGHVFAFEPDPYNAITLQKNLLLNKIKNVTIIKMGLFDHADSLPFDIQSIGSNIVSINHAFHNRKTINKIDVIPLDEIVKERKIKRINFIKMDIEGAEIEAMKGAIKTIKSNKNLNLAIASYHVVDGKKTSVFLEKFFKKLHMKVRTENRGQLITFTSNKQLIKV